MAGKQLMFIGGYSEEIVVASLDLENECLSKVASYPSGKSPSILCLHPSLPVLYAVNELTEGALEAFAIDRDSLALSPLGEPVLTSGADPAFITVDPTGKWLFFANYTGGNYGVAAIDQRTGELLHARSLSLIKVKKSPKPPVVPDRQDGPHPHQIITDPCTGKFIFVCDLGNDEIHTRGLDVSNSVLFHRGVKNVEVIPGSGPRHMIFSSDSRFAYVINELANTVHLYSYNATSGKLNFLKSWPTLDAPHPCKTMTAAELALSPDGKFLYASNRGADPDTIAVYSVDAQTGELELLGLDEVDGCGPRHFAFDRSGEMVVVGLQLSNKVTLMRRNKETGRLSLVSSLDGVTAPTYIQFMG